METIIHVAAQCIVVDPDLQPRVDGLDSDYIRTLEQVLENVPPIKVVQKGQSYVVLDGLHRLAAMQNAGCDVIAAELISDVDQDLHELAFELNSIHGRPLTLKDRRAFAERLLRSKPYMADREIARKCGLSSNTVGSVREQLEQSAQIEQTEGRVGRGGYTYAGGAYRNQRNPGELPDVGLVESVAQIFGASERKQQRRIASYFHRLSVALSDQADLEGWETNEQAAEACRLVFGDDRARELSQELGDGAHDVLQVAKRLGYEA